ncbi:MAG TPA: hypothetical protein VIA11_13430 [Acidimicrobiia bacterium]|jgi:hypothetical protein|nr:hypothetical protein [Acidimicrobiia bacterium]
MRLSAGRLAAAGLVIGALGVGGAGYAYAQSSSTTPSTPSTTAPSGGGGGQGHSTANCPNMGQSNNTSAPSDM